MKNNNQVLHTNYRPDIQGLRAIAVLAVMIFHGNKEWLPAGFLGVDIFFVISGYVVSYSIINSNKKVDIKRFYTSRIKRILPAYFFMLVIVTITASILFIPEDNLFYKDSLVSATFFYSNQYFANFGDYFAPLTDELPLLHTWSLSIEMQFYLLLPIFLLITPKKYLGVFFSILLILITTTNILFLSNEKQYFSLLVRIPEFIFGIVLAFYHPKISLSKTTNNALSVAGLLILSLTFLLMSPIDYPGIKFIIPSIGISLLIITNGSIINNTLSLSPFIFIGNLSYSLYLWHWPILAFFRYYTESYNLDTFLIIFYIIVSILLSLISYYLIENPLRKKGTRFTIIGISFIIVLLALSFYSNPIINRLFSPSIDVKYSRYADPNEICHNQILSSCYRGKKSTKADILVIGDSHTAQLNIFYEYIGNKENITFEVLSASSCIPIKNFRYSAEYCKNLIDTVDKKISQYDTIIIGAFWGGGYDLLNDSSTTKALMNFLSQMELMDKKIIIMPQLAIYESNMLRSLRFLNLHLPVNNKLKNSWEHTNIYLKSLESKYHNMFFFDISLPNFSLSRIYNKTPLYFDSHHLNEYGAEVYAKEEYDNFKNFLNKLEKNFTQK